MSGTSKEPLLRRWNRGKKVGGHYRDLHATMEQREFSWNEDKERPELGDWEKVAYVLFGHEGKWRAYLYPHVYLGHQPDQDRAMAIAQAALPRPRTRRDVLEERQK